MTLVERIRKTLRKAFGRRRKKSRTAFKMTTYGKGGVFPGVDLDNTSSLLDLMDGLDNLKRQYCPGEGPKAERAEPPEVPKQALN